MNRFIKYSIAIITFIVFTSTISVIGEGKNDSANGIFSENFEIYETNDNAYTDYDRAGAPSVCLSGVAGGRIGDAGIVYDDEYDVGAKIVDNNGDKELLLCRCPVHHINPSYTFQVSPSTGNVSVGFSFRATKIGDYGACIRIGTDCNSLYNDWTWTNSIAFIHSIEGVPSFCVWDEEQIASASAGGRKEICIKKLELNKEYNVVFYLQPFSNKYEVVINQENMGEYELFESPMCVTGIRIDQMGYSIDSDSFEELKDEIFYDDFLVKPTVVTAEPTVTPIAKPTVPPTLVPTQAPTSVPTPVPTSVPTQAPTDEPVITQTVNNTEIPVATDLSFLETDEMDSAFKDDSELDRQETSSKGTVFLFAIAVIIVAFLFIAIIIEKKLSNR